MTSVVSLTTKSIFLAIVLRYLVSCMRSVSGVSGSCIARRYSTVAIEGFPSDLLSVF